MNKRIMASGVMLLFTIHCQADVYRWVDSNGKVHYSDRKKADQAQNITRQVARQNIDTSSEEHRKLESILRKENDADREYAQQLAQEDQAQRQQICAQARERLKTISGYVIFLDEHGKVMQQVNEQQRQAKVAETQAVIDENCD